MSARTFKHAITAMVLAASAGVLAGPAAPVAEPAWVDVDAIVSYQTRQVLASGVTRTDAWQDRLVRRGNTVWTERVLPGQAETGHARRGAAEHSGHKHLNAETSARWLTLGPQGAVTLKLVDHEHRVVVEVPAAEFATVSFDGRLDAVGSIVPPAVARAMKSDGPAAVDGQWRSERNQGWVHKVLWSESRQLALRVDSRRDDGSVQRTVSVRLVPPTSPSTSPWQALSSYTTRHYDEYMD